MTELDATTDVVTLAEHADGFGQSVASRLEDAGIETVSDILIADEGALKDIPYVSATRAATIRDIADRVAGAPKHREVNFDETESVVTPHEQSEDNEPDPLVELREQVLDVGLGERVSLTFKDRDPLRRRYVSEVNDPVEWECPLGENYETRRVTITDSNKEYDLVATGDSVWLFGEYGNESGRLWEVETVAVVGRVSMHKFAKLKGRQQEEGAQKPEGDDSWQKYTMTGGETA